jgi:hypothetical protein
VDIPSGATAKAHAQQAVQTPTMPLAPDPTAILPTVVSPVADRPWLPHLVHRARWHATKPRRAFVALIVGLAVAALLIWVLIAALGGSPSPAACSPGATKRRFH